MPYVLFVPFFTLSSLRAIKESLEQKTSHEMDILNVKYKILGGFMKSVTNLKKGYWNPAQFSPFSGNGRCSPVPICHWIQAAFDIIFRDHKRLSKCIYRVKSAAVRSLNKQTN
jgi:hypothetical protein